MKLSRDTVAELIKLHFQGQDREFAQRVDAIADQLEAEGATTEAYMFRAAKRNAKARPEPGTRDKGQGTKPGGRGAGLTTLPRGKDIEDEAGGRSKIEVPRELSGFLYEVRPKLTLADMILDLETRQAADEFLRDLQAADLLQEHGLSPVRTLLLHGPPGDGKTTLAGAIALALELPLFVLRCAGLRSKWVGETQAQAAAAMRWLRKHELILFMDEADSLLLDRNRGASYTAEDTNALLTLLDEAPEHNYVFAATNRLEVIDPAARRRFEVTLELRAPGAAELAEYFERWAKGIKGRFKVDLSAEQAGSLAAGHGLSFAVLEQRLNGALRSHVIELAHCQGEKRKPSTSLSDLLRSKLELPGPPSQLVPIDIPWTGAVLQQLQLQTQSHARHGSTGGGNPAI
ncbi:AAA family ATPase [bacterium]|nr:AAA family ATPase [bacterium]